MVNNKELFVIKRNGRGREPLNIDKIHEMVEYACEDITGVSSSQVEMNSGLQFYNGITMEFILLLIRNNDFSMFSDILNKIVILMESGSKTKKIKITSHKEYSAEDQSEILNELKNKFKLDNTSDVKFSVDSSIMGGIKVRIGNKIIDGSVSTKLRKIKQSLLGI